MVNVVRMMSMVSIVNIVSIVLYNNSKRRKTIGALSAEICGQYNVMCDKSVKSMRNIDISEGNTCVALLLTLNTLRRYCGRKNGTCFRRPDIGKKMVND